MILSFFYNDPSEVVATKMYGASKPRFLGTDLELDNVPVPKPFAKVEIEVSDVDPFELIRALIEEMDRLCRAAGCRLVVMKFGTTLSPRSARLLEVERRFESRVGPLGLPYLDLDEVFAARGLSARNVVTPPDGHWNVAGHRETASALHRFLVDGGFLD